MLLPKEMKSTEKIPTLEYWVFSNVCTLLAKKNCETAHARPSLSGVCVCVRTVVLIHLYFWKQHDLSFVGVINRTCLRLYRSKRVSYATVGCSWCRAFSATMTMFQRMKITESLRWTNGNGNFATAVVDEEPVMFWRKLHINEWTVSVSLFLFSLSMTLGKLYFNYSK